MSNDMKKYLPAIDEQKMQELFRIETDYKAGRISAEQAQKLIAERVGKISAYHLAYVEQTMTEEQDDECIRENIHNVLHMLGDAIDTTPPQLPADHPLSHYLRENEHFRALLLQVEDLVQYPMIKNQWLELYDQIRLYPIHYKRKQNQLYPLLEKKGFMRPSTTMWTFDDMVRDLIRQSEAMLAQDDVDEDAFAELQQKLVEYGRDLMEKEELILFPTSLAMLSDHEWHDMNSGDHEIGFAFFTPEKPQPQQVDETTATDAGSLAADLAAVLAKHGLAAGSGGKDQLLKVTTGELTLEQINMIFQNLPIDISYVDENELVRFYSDTDHRIFPRSKNVIGREVMNCHPRKSAHVVREVIDKLRSGEQDRAEFWINKPGLFIYILYVALRDEQGHFRGVLEVMQDCTRIRAFTGSRTLLTWEGEQRAAEAGEEVPSYEPEITTEAEVAAQAVEQGEITPETRVADLLKQYPHLRDRMTEIHPMLRMLKTPFGKIMLAKARVSSISDHTGMPIDEVLTKLRALIQDK